MSAGSISNKDLILKTSPAKLFGYPILGAVVLVPTISFLVGASLEIVIVVALTTSVLLGHVLLRFYISRNHEPTRTRVENAPTDDEAFNIVWGSASWGLGVLCVAGAVFYGSLQAFVL